MNYKELFQKGYYLVGDSAYGLRSFLITPYDNAATNSPEDTFNYFHSSCRISVECAFGEIDMHWSIFWKPLGHKLSNVKYIIDACMRLHNFLVDYRIQNSIDSNIEFDEFEQECINHIGTNLNIMTGTNRNEPKSPNKQVILTNNENESRKFGINKRQNICNHLIVEGMKRPKKSSWRKQ